MFCALPGHDQDRVWQVLDLESRSGANGQLESLDEGDGRGAERSPGPYYVPYLILLRPPLPPPCSCSRRQPSSWSFRSEVIPHHMLLKRLQRNLIGKRTAGIARRRR